MSNLDTFFIGGVFLKKLLLGIILSSLLLAGCNSEQNNTKSSASNVDDKQSSQSTIVSNVNTFGTSYNDFFNKIQSSVQKEYPSLLIEEPEVSTLDATETTPQAITYTHSIFNSGQLVIYEEKSSNEIYQVFLSYKPFNETPENCNTLGYISGVLLANIETDITVAEKIVEELNLSNITQTITTYSTGTTADWIYVVDANEDEFTSTAMLTAIAS